MPSFYDYVTQKKCPIEEAVTFYLIPQTDGRFQLRASSVKLEEIVNYPDPKIKNYWPITKEQIQDARQDDVLFPNQNITLLALTHAQVEDYFEFNPTTTSSCNFHTESKHETFDFFKPKANISQVKSVTMNDWDEIGYNHSLDVISKHIAQLMENESLPAIDVSLCVQAIKNGIFTEDEFFEMRAGQLYNITQPQCLLALHKKTFSVPLLLTMPDATVNLITQSDCVKAIEEETYEIELLRNMRPAFLYIVTQRACIEAVKNNEIDFPDLDRLQSILRSLPIQDELMAIRHCSHAIQLGTTTIQRIVNIQSADELIEVIKTNFSDSCTWPSSIR